MHAAAAGRRERHRAFVVPDRGGLVDLVVHIGIDPDGGRRVREIVALPGRVESGVVEIADIFTTSDGRLVRAQGFPPHPERFARHGYDLPTLLAGRADDDDGRITIDGFRRQP